MSQHDMEVAEGLRCYACGEQIEEPGSGVMRLCPECDLDGEPPAERPKPKGGRHHGRPLPLRDVVVIPDDETPS